MLTLRESTAKVTIVFGIKVLSTSSVSSLSTSVPSPPKGKQYLPAPLRDQTAAGLVLPEVPGGVSPPILPANVYRPTFTIDRQSHNVINYWRV